MGNRSVYGQASPFPLPAYPALSVLQRVPGDRVHGLILHLVASTGTFQRGLESAISFTSTVVDPSCELSGKLSFAERDEIVGDGRAPRVEE